MFLRLSLAKLASCLFALFIILGAITFGIHNYFSNYYERNGIEIVKLPGSKTVELEEGEYWVWFFDEWKTYGVKRTGKVFPPYDSLELSYTADKKQIQLDPASVQHSSVTDKRTGHLVLKAQIQKAGKYKVSFKHEKTPSFIAVLAPQGVHTYGLGSNVSFDGY